MLPDTKQGDDKMQFGRGGFPVKGRSVMIRSSAFVTAAVVLGFWFNPIRSAAAISKESASLYEDVSEELSLGELLSMKINTGSFLELDLNNSPFSMTVISREMVRMSGARHMSELLEIYVPGFIYNYNKYYGTVWGMRGVANDRNTKIIYLVNGHKLNTQARDGFQGETSLGLLGDIERVEVLRGPAGLVYGSGAIAGIVNVVTSTGTDTRSSVSTMAGLDGSRSIEANVYGVPSDYASFAVSAGLRRSDGLPLSTSRIYPQGSNSPGWLGVPSDGRFGSTDGNWKIAMETDIDRFSFYMRATRQTENCASFFPLSPWPDRTGNTDSTFQSREIDGTMIQWNDPFWSTRTTNRISRKNYRSDNIMVQGGYEFPVGDNELTAKLGFDANTTRIAEENLEQYRLDFQYKNGRVIETFGERRYTLNMMYLLKTVPKLQAAFGAEYRFDDIGDDMAGKNEQLWNSRHLIVGDVNYHTFSFFAEGYYNVNDAVGLDGGVRLDRHTRAFMASPRMALIFCPHDIHSIKLLYQSAANNGSADNYEYGRYHIGNDGSIVTKPQLADRLSMPQEGSQLVQPAPPIKDMHSLKPERVHSAEAVYLLKPIESITMEASASCNVIKNLFGWEQSVFRVVNVGKYRFFNGDISINYNGRSIQAGISHTVQRPIFTDPDMEVDSFKIYMLVKRGDSYGEFDSIAPNGDSIFIPYYEQGSVGMNVVKNSVTYDGKSFLNLPTNITKWHVTISPFDWLSLSTNMRIIWGFPGREAVVRSVDVSVNRIVDTGEYFGYYGEKETEGLKDYLLHRVSKKWNAGVNFCLPFDLEASLYVYNILGTDRHEFTYKRADPHTVNTLRAAQMFSLDQRELYSTDQRTYGLTITKYF